MRVFFRVLLGRAADDAAIDEGGAGFLDDAGDAQHGGGVQGVAIDIDRLFGGGAQRGGELLRQFQRAARRQDRQDEVALGDLGVRGSGHAGGIGAGQRVRAAALEKRPDLKPARGEPFGHRAAHHARCDNGDDWLHGPLLFRWGMIRWR